MVSASRSARNLRWYFRTSQNSEEINLYLCRYLHSNLIYMYLDLKKSMKPFYKFKSLKKKELSNNRNGWPFFRIWLTETCWPIVENVRRQIATYLYSMHPKSCWGIRDSEKRYSALSILISIGDKETFVSNPEAEIIHFCADKSGSNVLNCYTVLLVFYSQGFWEIFDVNLEKKT